MTTHTHLQNDDSEPLQLPTGYASLEERKATGAHYTPKILANFLASEMVKVWARGPRPKTVRVLDPAVGDGELLVSILEELPKYGPCSAEVLGFDTDPGAVRFADARLKRLFPDITTCLRPDNFLEFAAVHGDGGAPSASLGPIDLVITNPPYVRTQVLGAKEAQRIAQEFGLSGRIDLYYAFIQGIAWILRPGGIAGIIVSNKFMTTKSGASVRRNIVEAFDVLHVWDLGDSRLFEAAVLPAVLLVKRKAGEPYYEKSRFTSVYTTAETSSAQQFPDIISALNTRGAVKLEDGRFYCVQQGMLNHGNDPSGVWRTATGTSEQWLAVVRSHTFCRFGEIGKVRVGVKTTADKVFIRSDWDHMPEDERPELLRPLVTHHIARRFKAMEPVRQRQILYTHQVVEGKRVTIDLGDFPRAARYLGRHRAILEGRKYVVESGRQWFEIWVPQDPNAWAQAKIIFRDISEKPTFWMDLTGSVVNGDCYWLACEESERLDLLWLALAVGNSPFIEVFYDRRFNARLYAGRRRFMTQFVEEFPLPNPDTDISRQIIAMAKEIYDLTPSSRASDLKEELDQLVWRAFGLTAPETGG